MDIYCAQFFLGLLSRKYGSNIEHLFQKKKKRVKKVGLQLRFWRKSHFFYFIFLLFFLVAFVPDFGEIFYLCFQP